jgi:opacity protein-like surface antigen
MKKILFIVVSLFTLLMFAGVALCAGAPAPAAKTLVEKTKPAKVTTVKKQHLEKVELTKGFYVSAVGGVAFLEDSDMKDNRRDEVNTDPGYAFAVAVGKRIGVLDKEIRVEGEIGYQKSEVDDCSKCRDLTGDIKAYSFLVNGYFDLVRGKKIVPYLTAGIGAAKVDADVNHFAHVDDIGLAYQVGAGIAYHISDNWHIDLKYRFFSVVEVDGFGLENLNLEFTSNNIFLGVRYMF